MQLVLAHHYWKDGKNATWYPQRFPFADLESAIKDDYVRLQAERPKWQVYGKTCVFFHYRPEKDIFGRDCVGISFAFFPNCKSPETAASVILPKLSQCRQDQLTMDISLSWDNTLSNHAKPTLSGNNARILIFGALGLLAVFAFVIYFLSASGKDQSAGKNIQTPGTEASPGQKSANLPLDKSGKDRSGKDQAVQEQASIMPIDPAKKESLSVAEANTGLGKKGDPGKQVTSSARARICDFPDLAGKLVKCPRVYVQEYCENGSTMISFDDWRKGNQECETWNKGDAKSLVNYHRRSNSPTREEVELVREVFPNIR